MTDSDISQLIIEADAAKLVWQNCKRRLAAAQESRPKVVQVSKHLQNRLKKMAKAS